VALGGKSLKKRAIASLGQPRQIAAPLTELNKTATIYRRMFSWAQPSYCETEEEYFLSKALFMKFVALRQVREVLGWGVGDAIIKFARESVIPHEERMAYFNQHDLLHLKTHMNCGPKGPNNGMKHCATVFPLSSIHIFWWNQCYLCGMSEKENDQKDKASLACVSRQ
jgi:hypothetical protein